EENLAFFASVFGTTVEANYEMIADVYGRLLPFKTRRAGALSGGMKQKLALSCALVHRPSVLILDEPTTGVDAVSRIEFWDMLDTVVASGITVLVSTPYMDEAERCHRIGLMQNGRIMDVNTPDGIVEQFSKPLFGIRTTRRLDVIRVLRQYAGTESVHPFGEQLHYVDAGPAADPTDLTAFLHRKGFDDVTVERIRPTVEDCFMSLMQ
ncbi:MAG: ATP-binding cassette domain-containing protein, partial [Rhodothermia bacterium]